MNHVMLDLETFGTKPGSILRSIGAVAFELDGRMGAEFYANIDYDSQGSIGLVADPNTVKWWSQQSKEAQDALAIDQQPLAVVVDKFHAWFRENAIGRPRYPHMLSGGQRCAKVWAQGANFDPALWEAAAEAVKRRVPWKFFEVHDTRTAYTIGNFDTAKLVRAGTYHNALDDAKHQVRCVAAAVLAARKSTAKEYDF